MRGRSEQPTIVSASGTHFKLLTRSNGRAWDNQGGRYSWSYHNSIVGTLGGTGTLTDHFLIKGVGEANGLFAQFAVDLTFDAVGNITGFVFTLFEGDPFDATRCAGLRSAVDRSGGGRRARPRRPPAQRGPEMGCRRIARNGLAVLLLGLVSLLLLAPGALPGADRDGSLDRQLGMRLAELGFTGRVEATLTQRLGRPLDKRLANLGRLLWFDTITGLNDDNTCAGCHSPTAGFGDTQSIAIGIDNNGIVGPNRTRPAQHSGARRS